MMPAKIVTSELTLLTVLGVRGFIF